MQAGPPYRALRTPAPWAHRPCPTVAPGVRSFLLREATVPHTARSPTLSPDLRAGLLRHFGHATFRPGQEPLARALLGGRDAIGLLPTGGGKSVTYLLPAALGSDLTLVVSPLVSLMADQVRRAREAGLPAGALHAGVPPAERADLITRARSGDLRVLLLAPERLTSPSIEPLLRSGRVKRVAIDEAHCLIQWGFDFRPAYLNVAGIGQRLGCPVLAVTATATPSVREAIERVLGLEDPVRVVGSFDRPNLRWCVRRVRREGDRWTRLRQALDGAGAALVYAPTRRSVEALRHALAARGIGAEAYHAGLGAGERARVQERFLGGGVRVVVATNAFGMGVDKSDVRRVIHWAPPASVEAWYQEAGRAGRDGRPAECLLLWAPDDLCLHARMAARSSRDRSRADLAPDSRDPRVVARWREASRRRLRAMSRFVRGRGCRRHAVLTYLGENDPPRRCAACDRCCRATSL